MGKPLHLDRLPKAGRLRAVNFRRTTPGNYSRLIAPQSEPRELNVLDKSHPWADKHPRTYASKLPGYQNEFMKVRAFPKALLGPPEQPYCENAFPPAPKTPYGKDGRVEGDRKKVNMSLMHIVAKKNVHKLAAVRKRVKSKIRMAIGLIVAHGATVERVGGKERLVESGDDNGEKWVMQDWTYLFMPNLEVYRMPVTTLISGIQKALLDINAKCRTLENVWKLEALRHRPAVDSKLSRLDDRSKRGSMSGEGRNKRSADALARVKALLKPYTSLDLIPDVDLLEGEGDEDEDLLPVQPSPKRSPILLKRRLPPRSRITEPEVDDTRETRYAVDTEDLEDVVERMDDEDVDAETKVVRKGDRGPSFIQAMYNRKPILKPIVPEKKPRSRKR